MEEFEKYLKNIRDSIDAIAKIDQGLGSIFNTGFNYSIKLLDAKFSEKEMSSTEYINLILEATGTNLGELFIKYINDHNMNNSQPNLSKVDSEIVDFIANSNVDNDLTLNDLGGMSTDEYKKFINDNLEELKEEIKD